jgi:hypothetical protein
MKRSLRELLCLLKKLKCPNLGENRKFYQNYETSTNVSFCDKSYDGSLVEILKYLVYEVYGCTTHLRKWEYFEFERKKKQLNVFFSLGAQVMQP